jgi:hypothetical protein
MPRQALAGPTSVLQIVASRPSNLSRSTWVGVRTQPTGKRSRGGGGGYEAFSRDSWTALGTSSATNQSTGYR